MFKPVMLALASLTAVSFSSLGLRPKVSGSRSPQVTVMTATFYDNATTRALVSRFPLTLPMEDLYGREMCYRFPDALPANETQTSGYEVGDVVYWAPRHGFVIMYEQNNERIGNLQKVGRIHSGVGIFRHTGNIDVTFEMAH